MAWYSSQTRIRLLAPEDPDERGELKRDAKTLWEKLRDGMAGINQEVMAAHNRNRYPHIALRPSPLNGRVGCFPIDDRGNANGPSRASYASCKATNDSSNGSRCANLTLARRICTFCRD
uniref:Uncharacterized protein n=1 Tax=Oryza glumipatula TaxID=40148 RepID=A0A0D9YTG6_9ORYZ